MLIRELREGEWPLWRRLAIAAATDSPDAFRPTVEGYQSQSDDEWIELIESTVRHPRGSLWIAAIEDEPVGMVFARIDSAFAIADFGSMWVAPHVRGSGVGSALLTAVIEWAEAQGAGAVECWVTEGNEPATAVYRQHGFKPTDETQALRTGSDVTVRKMYRQLVSHA